MLELIQQEDWHGLTVYVAVRVAIVLICWDIFLDKKDIGWNMT